MRYVTMRLTAKGLSEPGFADVAVRKFTERVREELDGQPMVVLVRPAGPGDHPRDELIIEVFAEWTRDRLPGVLAGAVRRYGRAQGEGS